MHRISSRTAAHNQVWQAIISALKRTLQPEWRLFIEISFRDTGLLRGPEDHQPSVRRSQSVPDLARFGNLLPDAVLVNEVARQLAILDLTRPFDRGDRPANERRHAEGPEFAIPGERGGAGGSNWRCCPLCPGPRPNTRTFSITWPAQHSGGGERKFEAYGELAQILQ